MKSSVLLLAAASAIVPTYAFTFSFFGSSQQTTLNRKLPNEAVTNTNRIAIIGAGAGGSSAAFWIAKAKERYGLDVEVDVYEKNAFIGGRSTTVFPYEDESLEPVELGASIFVAANKNLQRAAKEFALDLVDFEDNANDVTGIWDGDVFVLTVGGNSVWSGWLDKIKLLWRYGYQAPTKTQAIVSTMLERFATLYDSTGPRWSNISSVVSELGWDEVTARSTSEYLDSQGIDKRWTRELIEAATRVNYGQNSDKIHALEGLCSVAADGGVSVKGGNWKIFESFVKESGANAFLNTTVTAISRDSADSPFVVETASSLENRSYRAVILAAPFHQTAIKVGPAIAQVPEQPYVHLHVTLLSTSSPTPNPAYFKLGSSDKTPTTVLTTYNGVRERGGAEPEFNSLSYHGAIAGQDGTAYKNAQGEGEWVVKIFSKARVEDEWLKNMFDGKVGWVLRKEWDAYPVLPPTITFPPVKLAEGLYYVNAFEPLISTMETETIASRNVVDLLLQEQFQAGICKPAEDGDAPKNDSFVYGWDC
ncbi:FAD/NAD(P)-binding domain-containing protein [Trametes elegans]|nr:FAD/NAD(P)-binding domain-containing protein [Trametes elegans]